MRDWPRSIRLFSAALFALLVALVTFCTASPARGQQPQRHPFNPPALPHNASRPASPTHMTRSLPPAPGPASSLSSTSWTAIGPASLNEGDKLVSGRVTGIAVDPSNANTIYIAAAGGGVWKTTDGGTTWTPLTDNQPTLAMGAIAIAPTDPQRIYAGTGEANNSADSNHGEGILVSRDGGASWTLVDAGGALKGTVIGQIAVDPTNENVAYAAVGGYGLNAVANANEGIYKTSDGGTTWSNVTNAASLTAAAAWSAVVVDPNTPTIVYAAVGDVGGSTANGVYRSTDSGVTWGLLANIPVSTDTGRIALAVSPAANQQGKHVLYVAIESIASGGLGYFGRSDNADAAVPAFTDLTTGTPDFLGAENGGGQGWYDIALNVDANGVVYCAGVENYNGGGTQAVITSSTLGVTWSDISIVSGFAPHTDNHAIAFDSDHRVLLGNDGGVYRYDPTVPSWTDLNANLNTIQLSGIGLHPTSLNLVTGGSQDNGTELYSNNLEWMETEGGDGGLSLYSPTNASRCYAIHPIASFGSADFFRRSDSGCAAGSWQSETTGLSGTQSNFYPPFVVDRTNGDHVLLGMDYVNESTDGATSWTAIGTPATNGFNPLDYNVDSIALSPANGSNPQVVYAATGGSFATSSKIFVTSNDGGNWTEVDLPSCSANGSIGLGCRVNQIVVDPSDLTGHTAFAVTSEFTSSGNHVFMTANAGASWTDISANLPNLPVWSVQVDTDADHTVYIANETAVYSSPSPYSTWTAVGTGLPNAQAVDLELNSNLHVLGVATHGRGAWEILTPGAQLALNLTINGAGTGTVSSSPSGISCGASCSANFAVPSSVTLTATAGANSTFTGWNGCDTSSGNACTVAMTEIRNVTATFLATPTVTWPQASAITYGQALSASTLSGGSAVFGSNAVAGSFAFSSPATTPTAGAQTEDVVFTPTDTSSYSTVKGTVSVTVNQAAPAISWGTPGAITYGAALGTGQLNASSTVAGSFAYSPAAGTVLTVGAQKLNVTFTPTDTTDYTTATASVTLQVNQATPAITWSTPVAISYGTALGTTQLDASSTVAGSFAYSPAAGAVLGVGAQKLNVTFTPTDTTNYTTATASVTLQVNQATPTITWGTPAAVVYGTALSATQLNATASVAGSFAYSPAAGAVLSAGAQKLSVTFTPTDTTNYTTATASVTLQVNQVTPTITWTTPAPVVAGTALSATQLNASASVAGTFAYTPAAGTVLALGNNTLSVTFTPTDSVDYKSATATVTLAVVNPTPVITKISPPIASAGGAAFGLTVNGAGFVPTSIVYWGSTALTTEFVSTTQLAAQVQTANIASAGVDAVTVQTAAPGGGTSNPLQFEVDSAGSGAAPTFTTVTASVAPGASATYPVTLPSSGTFNSVTCLNLPSGAQCSYASGVLTITTTSATPAGTYQITVVFTETMAGKASTAFFLLPILLLPLVRFRKQLSAGGLAVFTVCLALLLLAGATTIGCGGSSSTHQATSSGAVTLTVQ